MGSTDEKHLQYLFCTLGTPKAMGYTDFNELPLAGVYGGQIVVSQCQYESVLVVV